MIHEFALEPQLLASWESFRYLTEKFGVSQGRLISRYPKRWKGQVYEALAACGEIERKRIEVKLQEIDAKLISRFHEWNDGIEWLANAEREHLQRPFRAIVARDNPRNDRFVLKGGELDEGMAEWHVDRSCRVPRDAISLADKLAPLLRCAQEIYFIDMYFDPNRQRSQRTLKEFCARAMARGTAAIPRVVRFLTRYDPMYVGFNEACNKTLPPLIPRGLRVEVNCLEELPDGEGLHNRFLLTDRGGVTLGWGLDEGVASQTDDLSLMDQAHFEERRAQYCSDPGAFRIRSTTMVIGTAVI